MIYYCSFIGFTIYIKKEETFGNVSYLTLAIDMPIELERTCQLCPKLNFSVPKSNGPILYSKNPLKYLRKNNSHKT